MRLAVLPEHRPTLPELVAPRLARLPRTALYGLLAVLATTVALAAVLIARAGGGDVVVVRRSPVAFNFVHSPALSAVRPRRGELLRIEDARRGLFVQSFAVAPLALPAYSGDAGGTLPVVAAREIDALRRSHREFELVQEGKARLNEVAGYQLVFRARLGRRRLFARVVLLPEPAPGARRGVRLVLEATPAAGVGRPEDVGARGLTKRPFRSFRFGTERP